MVVFRDMARLIFYNCAKNCHNELRKWTLISSDFLLNRSFSSQTNSQPDFGLLFDIDGVIVRGKKIIPNVPETFKKLVNSEGKFRVPTVFLTNAGNALTRDKARQLSEWLDLEVSDEQVVMAHSPLRAFKEFHNKNVLVSGQGPIEEISKRTGFKSIVTIEEVRKAFPLLDAVDHKRRVSQPVSNDPNFKRIEGVVLFGEPVRWETSLQLIVDVLMTNGDLNQLPRELSYPHIPILACNMDLQWMAEANMPRFGHGAFLVCLEELYKKITGKDLIYKALIGKPSEVTYRYAQQVLMTQARYLGLETNIKHLYAIGDNINTDIFGANLYNEYLTSSKCDVPADVSINRDSAGVTNCHSVLVKTGVFTHELSENELDHAPRDFLSYGTEYHSPSYTTGVFTHELSENELDHAPRDFLSYGREYRSPSYTVEDVSEAIQLIFKLQGFQ